MKLAVTDYIILVFLALSLIVGARRGFARTAGGVVGVLMSLIAAIVCSGTLTTRLALTLRPLAEASLLEQLSGVLPVGAETLSHEAAAVLMNTLEAPVLKPVVFVIAFLAVQVLWLYACSYLGLLERFPVVKKFTQLAGAALGLLKGVVILAVAVYLLSRLGILSDQQLHGSFLLGRFSEVLGVPQ